MTKNWEGKIQVDFGKSLDADEVAVKDAYMQYIGWTNHKVFIGNSKAVFSREFLTSSKRQQTVERWFVGQHNFGSPDRMLGFRIDGNTDSKRFEYKFNVGGESFDPDNKRMDFDTPVNDAGDWNLGWVGAGRLTYYPREPIQRDQGDFKRGSFNYALEAAAFYWTHNDNDLAYTEEVDGVQVCNNTTKCDLDKANGWELSGGFRGRGLSIDLEYNQVAGEMIANSVDSGMYANGETTIKKWQLEGGYILGNLPLEFVYKRDSMDTDGYEKKWYANDIGVNYFFNQHKAKVQLVYRIESNVNGEDGDDRNQLVMQWQSTSVWMRDDRLMKPTQSEAMRNPRLPVVAMLGLVLLSAIRSAEAEASSLAVDPVIGKVVEMLTAGVDEAVIVQWLDATGRRPADIASQGVIALTEVGASERLITALLELVDKRGSETPEAEPIATVAPTTGEIARPEMTGDTVEVIFQLGAKRIWVDEDEPDRPRDPPWDIYLYLDGELVAWATPTLQGEAVEVRRILDPGPRELGVVLQRYEEMRSGWLYESLSVPVLIGFEARLGNLIEVEVEMRRIWGLWRQRKDGGPLSYVIKQGGEILAEHGGTGGDPDRWNPVCEDVEANFPVGDRTPKRFRNSMSRCVRWADLWTGVGGTTSRAEILAGLAGHGFEPPVR